MEQTQIEELVAELETRVDRLRSLYEQYFMGIEKMEPLVPKKDVERRFQTMRREQIRNTALRFRFHMVLQKYNTYQSYWMRIMRQIEDGTYKRDVLRARAAFAERRSTRPPPPSQRASQRPKEKEKESEHSIDIDTFELEDSDFPADAPTRKVDVPALGKALGGFDPFDEAPTNLLTRPPTLSDEEDPTGILPLVAGGPKPKPRLAADPEKMRQLAAQIKAKKAIDGKEPTPPPRMMVAEAPPIHQARKPPPLPPRPGAAKPEPPVVAKPAPPAPKPMLRPEAPKPAAPIATAKPAIPAPAQKPVSPADLPDARVRQIYTQYVDTKRKQNESTAAITYEGVAKSLRESTARLKEKHGGKAVDFEVTVKDGKTILRPVVK